MDTATLQHLVRQEAKTVHGVLWPNRLGFDVAGANRKLYEVWYPIEGVWRVRCCGTDGQSPESHGAGLSAMQALANCTNPIES